MFIQVNRNVGNVRSDKYYERTNAESGKRYVTQLWIPYLSDDSHEIRLVNVLLDVL